MLPFKGARGSDITQVLELYLSKKTSFIAGTSSYYAQIADPLTLLNDQRAELVFSGYSKKIGGHFFVKLFSTKQQQTTLIWSEIFNISSSNQYILNRLTKGLEKFNSDNESIVTPDWPTTQRYLKAIDNFTKDRTEKNVNHTLLELQAVVRLYPQFSPGHASLCAMLIEQSILTHEKEHLREAAIHCKNALDLDASSTVSLLANSNLARKTGGKEQALAYVNQVLVLDPASTTAMYLKAKLLAEKYMKVATPALFSQVEALLNQAIKLSPNNWKYPFTLANYYYAKGDSTKAIIEATKAVSIFPSFQTYNNLATIHFCAGNLSHAKDFYNNALTHQPDNLTIKGNLATLFYYLEEYQQAITMFEAQIPKLVQKGSDHLPQHWGNIGDAYRLLGNNTHAIAAYKKSLQLLDQDIVKGSITHRQKTYRLATHVILSHIDPQIKNPDLTESLKNKALLLQNTSDTESLFQLALSWVFLGEMDKAHQLRLKLASHCPGFVASPDFKQLNHWLAQQALVPSAP